MLIEDATSEGKPLPHPVLFDHHAYAPGETADSIARENAALAGDLEPRAGTPAN